MMKKSTAGSSCTVVVEPGTPLTVVFEMVRALSLEMANCPP